MRRWKAKSKRKFLYLLDNREYTKMRNGDATSPPQVPVLYIYIGNRTVLRAALKKEFSIIFLLLYTW